MSVILALSLIVIQVTSLSCRSFPDHHAQKKEDGKITDVIIPLLEKSIDDHIDGNVLDVLPYDSKSIKLSKNWEKLKHLVDLTPLRTKGKDGESPLAIILATPKSLDANKGKYKHIDEILHSEKVNGKNTIRVGHKEDDLDKNEHSNELDDRTNNTKQLDDTKDETNKLKSDEQIQDIGDSKHDSNYFGKIKEDDSTQDEVSNEKKDAESPPDPTNHKHHTNEIISKSKETEQSELKSGISREIEDLILKIGQEAKVSQHKRVNKQESESDQDSDGESSEVHSIDIAENDSKSKIHDGNDESASTNDLSTDDSNSSKSESDENARIGEAIGKTHHYVLDGQVSEQKHEENEVRTGSNENILISESKENTSGTNDSYEIFVESAKSKEKKDLSLDVTDALSKGGLNHKSAAPVDSEDIINFINLKDILFKTIDSGKESIVDDTSKYLIAQDISDEHRQPLIESKSGNEILSYDYSNIKNLDEKKCENIIKNRRKDSNQTHKSYSLSFLFNK